MLNSSRSRSARCLDIDSRRWLLLVADRPTDQHDNVSSMDTDTLAATWCIRLRLRAKAQSLTPFRSNRTGAGVRIASCAAPEWSDCANELHACRCLRGNVPPQSPPNHTQCIAVLARTFEKAVPI